MIKMAILVIVAPIVLSLISQVDTAAGAYFAVPLRG